MLDRTKDGAYVWSYGSSGVSSIKAQDVLQNAPRPHRPFNGETLDKFFRQVLDCLRGDFDLAPTGIFSDRHKLSEYVNEIGAQTGVAVSVK
jgi:hypothetical protein